MSTFNGIIHEFPDIRVDFFRGFDRRPPLACFLSHVHSDHLAGLDKIKSPFIYCSAATREILLRLEKYPCRLNHAKGIFEDPRMQTYKHLAKVLKPIPLDTPTEVELEPGKNMQVTLLDANHCAGAVMFLFEVNDKSALYTGDIRSEPWFVNSIARNPAIIEYSTGLKTLDRIYLDTSMLDNISLQTKAEGLRELLEKVSRYPEDTIFHLQAWTYGYEEVWVALSKALNSKIHVDKYKMGIYKSLATKSADNRFAAQTHLTKDAPYLVGFTCGNIQREGCLTLDEGVRIHSCEKGMGCSVVETKPVVWIQPIVAHLRNNRDMIEVGIGGGGNDLAQKPNLDAEDILALIEMISKVGRMPDELKDEIQHVLKKASANSRDIGLDINMSDFTDEESTTKIIQSLVKKVKAIYNPIEKLDEKDHHNALPNHIVFPYARHSSLPELRHFVKTFKPKDIWPCTVDPPSWDEKGITMRGLFGSCCSGDVFEHDRLMKQRSELGRRSQGQGDKGGVELASQVTTSSHPEISSQPIPSHSPIEPYERNNEETTPVGNFPLMASRRLSSSTSPYDLDIIAAQGGGEPPPSRSSARNKRDHDSFQNNGEADAEHGDDENDSNAEASQASAISAYAYETRLRAFLTAQSNIENDGDTWGAINLISTTDNHSTIEPELGGS
ncbi:hypothetical protein AAE478_007946 [Parahypoxylon ruwenzoriense]